MMSFMLNGDGVAFLNSEQCVGELFSLELVQFLNKSGIDFLQCLIEFRLG